MSKSKKPDPPATGDNLAEFRRLGFTFEDIFPKREPDESDPLYQQIAEVAGEALPKLFPEAYSDHLFKQASESSMRHRVFFGADEEAGLLEDYALEVIDRILPRGSRPAKGASLADHIKGLSGVEVLDLQMAVRVVILAELERKKIRELKARRLAVSRGGSARKRASGAIEAAVELGRSLKSLDFKSLWEAFEPYTLTDRYEVEAGGFLFQVWRDLDWLHEQRVFPPGNPKQLSRDTFRKKPYYWPAIKSRLSP